MPPSRRYPPAWIALRRPLIALVLAFTAIPIDLQPLTRQTVSEALQLNLDVVDVIANVLGYIPVGFVLASKSTLATVALSGGLSLLAETSQLFSRSRTPGWTDVATNVLGAVIGLAITARWKREWKIGPPVILVGRRKATLAAMLAAGYLGSGAGVTPVQVEETIKDVLRAPRLLWLEVNPRGATTSGRLEAEWTFEDTSNEAAIDVSGNGLNGQLVNAPVVENGPHGSALTLNGVDRYVALGHPTALQLTGSATISAWIKAIRFPVDDAAVVSDYSGLGYQLDATVDMGSRTIGFKLANAEGRMMARYGKTLLSPDTWYYIAGVYDAQAMTLNVYLNGEEDNGCLRGTVTDRQRPSGMDTYIGRRASSRGFEFAGAIDDVRIYSRALTQSEIQADFLSARGVRSTGASTGRKDPADLKCPPFREEAADSRSMGLVVSLGVLVSVAMLGFVPTVSRQVLCIAPFAAGFLLFSTLAPTLPAGYKWLLPLMTLAGGASIAFSILPREARS